MKQSNLQKIFIPGNVCRIGSRFVLEHTGFNMRSTFHWRHDIQHNDIPHNDTLDNVLICDT